MSKEFALTRDHGPSEKGAIDVALIGDNDVNLRLCHNRRKVRGQIRCGKQDAACHAIKLDCGKNAWELPRGRKQYRASAQVIDRLGCETGSVAQIADGETT